MSIFYVQCISNGDNCEKIYWSDKKQQDTSPKKVKVWTTLMKLLLSFLFPRKFCLLSASVFMPHTITDKRRKKTFLVLYSSQEVYYKALGCVSYWFFLCWHLAIYYVSDSLSEKKQVGDKGSNKRTRNMMVIIKKWNNKSSAHNPQKRSAGIEDGDL